MKVVTVHDLLPALISAWASILLSYVGENIAPVPIEDNVKKQCPIISNFMMVGDKRKYNVALVTLKAVGATGEAAGTDMLDGPAAELNIATKTITAAMSDPIFAKTITDAIVATNKDGSVVPSNAACIQKFTILPTDFSQDGEPFISFVNPA